MSKFDSLILDIDGTIWDTTGIVAKGWNLAIEKTFPEVPRVTPDILKCQFGKTMKEIAENLFPDLNADEKEILKHQCNVEEKKLIEKLEDDISFPNVRKTIPVLARNFKIFIVSNCQNGYIHITMEKNGIKDFITDWECHGNTGKTKGENIKDIVQRNGLKYPVYVGDTQSDYEACKVAGVPFVWAAYGFGKPESYDYKIDDFANIVKILC